MGKNVLVADLVALAQQVHPVAQVGAAIRDQARAEILQARAWANPEVEVELGRARSRITDDEEAIAAARLGQRFEWPGKRRSRIRAAGASGDAALAEAQLQRLEVEAAVRHAAVDLTIARKAAALAQESATSLQEIVAVVERRAAAGEAGRSDTLRVQMESSRAAQAVEDSAREVAASHAALNAWCGGALPVDVIVTDAQMAPAEAVAARLEAHPQMIQLAAIIRQRRAEIARESATAMPDVTVGVFAEREADVDNTGVAVGLEIPIWNRNQGGRAAATAALARAEAELASLRLRLSQAVHRAKVEVETANSRLSRFSTGLRPAAEETLRLALLTYQAGESGILDLLEALRTAHDVREQMLDAERRSASAFIVLFQAAGSFTPILGAMP